VVSLSASLALALLAMGMVELFNRSGPQPTVVIAQSLGGLPYQGMPPFLSGGVPDDNALSARAMPLLPRQAALPRELSHQEVSALIRAGNDADRVAMLMLLAGVSPFELIEMRWTDVDLAQRLVRIKGESAREVVLSEPLRRLLAAKGAQPDTDLVVGALGGAATTDSIDARILCAAHDGGLDSASEITAECLRPTSIAFLVRQRIRFADLTPLVGRLSREALGQYSALAPAGSRAAREAVDTVMPAVRDLGSC
jgi:integrase